MAQKFKQFIGSGTLTIFDIDDTLFHTTAKIKVNGSDGKTVKHLTSSEFNTHKLDDGHNYDFSEFRSAKQFAAGSAPIVKMVEKARRIVKAKGNPHSRAIIVTARGDFDDKELFLQTFRDHGIPIDSMYVERAGKINKPAAEGKKIIFRKYLQTGNYIKTRLYDDAMSNLEAFLSLKQEFPKITFEAYLVKPDGSTERK